MCILVQSKKNYPCPLVHCAYALRYEFTAANLFMILLEANLLKTSKFSVIRHKATARYCDVVDLSSLFTLFSTEKPLSPGATLYGKVSNNQRAVTAVGKVAATSP